MPKNTKKSQGKKKLQLSNKQFEDLLKEVGVGLPQGMTLDATLMAALRQATDDQFNKVAVEKFGEIPDDSDGDEGDDEQMKEEQATEKPNETVQEQQPSSSNAQI